QRFNGRVLEVTSDKVKIDLNHPLAGRTLNFKGKILVNREPTSEELTKYVQMLSGNGCGEGCECGGHCGSGDNEEGCCGKHDHDDEHCGHHHHEDGHCCGKHKG
ncbi:MAG: peptidylprolyl isomerase, partial [Prevotella sp.]|nr:peptidylprolyl isomerase [Prevotella sp.]